jgi:deazaflavin-dependent oxidoreductase (nitroreductase family)
VDDAARQALARDRVIDITTTGRKSGRPRRLETWFHRVDGRIYLSGWPGKRDWYANLEADPRFTFHLKGTATADLPATAVLITDADERRRILSRVVSDRESLEHWLAGSPLVEIVFDD